MSKVKNHRRWVYNCFPENKYSTELFMDRPAQLSPWLKIIDDPVGIDIRKNEAGMSNIFQLNYKAAKL